MDRSDLVDRTQGSPELAADGVEVRGTDQPPPDREPQVAASAKLERDEAELGLGVEQGDDVRAADPSQGAGLGEEPGLEHPHR